MLAQLVQLGDVVFLIGGGTPSKSNEGFYDGDIPWATVRDMKQEQLSETEFQISEEAVKKSSTNIIEAGNIITATRVGLGKVCVLQQDTAINQDIKALIPKDGRLDKKYLFWWLKSVAHVIEAAGTGATVKGVKIPFVKALEIPLPTITEQKRIVAILDQAFADIDKARALTEQNLKNARELFESYLQQVFDSLGSECDLKSMSDETMLSMIDGDRGKNYPKKSDFLEDGYCLFLSTKNVRPDGFLFDETMFIDKSSDNLLRKGRLKRNDVVITTRGTIGNLALYDDSVEFEHIRINSGMLILRPNIKTIHPSYLFEIMRSGIVKRQIEQKISGAAQPQLPVKTLNSFVFPVYTRKSLCDWKS